MPNNKKAHLKEKSGFHLRSKHGQRYDFKQLIECCPQLGSFVYKNNKDDETINFFDPTAVIMLNKALLKYFYKIEYWQIPKNYLCPPIPGRAEYIHYVADLLAGSYDGNIPTGSKIKCLDIGVGANCIYPIIGHQIYDWNFVGSDIDLIAIDSANKIVAMNPQLKDKIELRVQPNPKDIYNGIIDKSEFFDLSICNPPFHVSPEEAQTVAIHKLTNLSGKKIKKPILNFGGQHHELSCEGGEKEFLHNMIQQSKEYSNSVFWFSTLVSKKSKLKDIYKALQFVTAKQVKTIPINHGNKISRIVAWSYFIKKGTNKLH